MDVHSPTNGHLRTGAGQLVGRVLGALLLLAMGGIHLYLVFEGFGGLLGILFVINAVGGLVLAIAVIAAPLRLLPLAAALGFLFTAGTLLGLALALTVGLFGIREQIDGELVPTTLVVEGLGVLVLGAMTVLAIRTRSLDPRRRPRG
jgi:hypothetical protein